MVVQMFGDTNVGRVRKVNQDSIYFDEQRAAGIVADGIGGRKGGEIASGIVAQEFARFLQRTERLAAKRVPETYAALLEEINTKIYTFGERYKDLQGLGTTATAMQFVDDQLFVAHCGDSRAYLFVDDHLFRLTIDHNLASAIKHGWIDAKSVPQKTKRDILTRGVGLADYLDVDIYQLKVSVGQIFLACSDGLSDMVDDRKILKILRTTNKLSSLPRLLIKEACDRGGRDNITVLVSKVVEL